MDRQFSLAHLTVLGCPPPEAVYIARMTGYDFVSLRIIPLGDPVYDLAHDPQLMRWTKTALADTGLTVLDIELARILPDIDVRVYAPAFEAAAELGARHVISSIWSPDTGFVIDKLVELCEIAAPLGLTIDVEYLPFVPLNRFGEVLDIVLKVGRPNCGLLIDTLYAGGVDPEELDHVPRGLVNLIHLCDGPKQLPALGSPDMFHTVREERLHVGEGDINIVGLMRRLPKVPCSIELPNLPEVKQVGYAEHARRCLEKARRYVAGRVDL